MKAVLLVFSALGHIVTCILYDNVTIEPGMRQLYDFKQTHPSTVGLMTTSSGDPVELRDTLQINSDQFNNHYNYDVYTHFDGERAPERVVHAKGTAAFGYLEVTNDVTKYTSADLFSRIGKNTPLVVRFSSAVQSAGGSDVAKELKGMAVKFYTDQGNLDLLCLQTPVYLYRDPIQFPHIVHAFKKNPRTGLLNPTSFWDFVTLKPETMHSFLWFQSDYGTPNGYRRMDGFPIHTYEITNKHGDRHYVRFSFRTEQGIAHLMSDQVAQIQGRDLDYFTRDLYNAIGRKEYPMWRMEMDVLTLDDLKNVDYDPFDVTRLWKNGTYTTVPIGRIVLNRNPDNFFRVAEQSAFNPGNLVPGIPGPVDRMYKARRLAYLDTQNYRLGRNHNKITVNSPKYSMTYNRDGKAPVRDNMQDIPNYYPNSFNGPMPYVDETRPSEVLSLLEQNSVDLQPSADFYNKILVNDAQRQRLVESLVESLVTVNPPVQARAVKFMYLIDHDLGKRVELGLKAAIVAARANESG